MIFGGLLLWSAALLLTGYNIWDEHRALKEVQTTLAGLNDVIAEEVYFTSECDDLDTKIPNYIRYPNMEMPTVEVEGQLYLGVLIIPSINIELPIISSWDYEKLKVTPCRYTGLAYTNTMVIAAHNFRSHFGKLNELAIGDSLTFTDTDGNDFNYQVTDLEILSSSAVTDMISGGWDLTLFTCTAGGQNRLTIRCVSVQE